MASDAYVFISKRIAFIKSVGLLPVSSGSTGELGYQRLEYIGDSILKVEVTKRAVRMFSFMKQALLSGFVSYATENKNLENFFKKCRLGLLFEGPGMAGKTVADAVETLIGELHEVSKRRIDPKIGAYVKETFKILIDHIVYECLSDFMILEASESHLAPPIMVPPVRPPSPPTHTLSKPQRRPHQNTTPGMNRKPSAFTSGEPVLGAEDFDGFVCDYQKKGNVPGKQATKKGVPSDSVVKRSVVPRKPEAKKQPEVSPSAARLSAVADVPALERTVKEIPLLDVEDFGKLIPDVQKAPMKQEVKKKPEEVRPSVVDDDVAAGVLEEPILDVEDFGKAISDAQKPKASPSVVVDDVVSAVEEGQILNATDFFEISSSPCSPKKPKTQRKPEVKKQPEVSPSVVVDDVVAAVKEKEEEKEEEESQILNATDFENILSEARVPPKMRPEINPFDTVAAESSIPDAKDVASAPSEAQTTPKKPKRQKKPKAKKQPEVSPSVVADVVVAAAVEEESQILNATDFEKIIFDVKMAAKKPEVKKQPETSAFGVGFVEGGKILSATDFENILSGAQISLTQPEVDPFDDDAVEEGKILSATDFENIFSGAQIPLRKLEKPKAKKQPEAKPSTVLDDLLNAPFGAQKKPKAKKQPEAKPSTVLDDLLNAPFGAQKKPKAKKQPEAKPSTTLDDPFNAPFGAQKKPKAKKQPRQAPQGAYTHGNDYDAGFSSRRGAADNDFGASPSRYRRPDGYFAKNQYNTPRGRFQNQQNERANPPRDMDRYGSGSNSMGGGYQTGPQHKTQGGHWQGQKGQPNPKTRPGAKKDRKFQDFL